MIETPSAMGSLRTFQSSEEAKLAFECDVMWVGVILLTSRWW